MSGAPVDRLFSEAEIAARVEALGAEIVAAVGPDFVVVGVLKGSFVFLADLARALSRAGCRAADRVHAPCRATASGRESSGIVSLLGDAPDGFEGKPVLLVDDILDTGLSMAYGPRLLLERGAAGVWTCALLDKPSRRKVESPRRLHGFEIEDVFVVGYGIDYAEQYRYLPYIGKVT